MSAVHFLMRKIEAELSSEIYFIRGFANYARQVGNSRKEYN